MSKTDSPSGTRVGERKKEINKTELSVNLDKNCCFWSGGLLELVMQNFNTSSPSRFLPPSFQPPLTRSCHCPYHSLPYSYSRPNPLTESLFADYAFFLKEKESVDTMYIQVTFSLLFLKLYIDI